MVVTSADRYVLDAELARLNRAISNDRNYPLAIRRFVEYNGGIGPIDTIQKVVTELLDRYADVMPYGSPISVEALCRLTGVRLVGTAPTSQRRSSGSYASNATVMPRAGHTGILRYDNSEPVISIPEFVDRDTARLSVAHELGHFLIHWRGTSLDVATMRLPSDPLEEALAEYAARLLLMPRDRWLHLPPTANLSEEAIKRSGLTGVTIHAATLRLGDPDLYNLHIRGAILWRFAHGYQSRMPVHEQMTPHWFQCPGAFIPVGRSKARLGSVVDHLASISAGGLASRIEHVSIGTLVGTYLVDGYAWGCISDGNRLVLTIFREVTEDLAIDLAISRGPNGRPETLQLSFAS